MRKNKRRQQHVRLLPLPVTTAVVFTVSIAVAYLVLDHKCGQCGQQIKKSEQKLTELDQQRIREEANWNRLKTPEEIEQAMLRHGLLLVYPGPDQVARVASDGRIRASAVLVQEARASRAGVKTVAVP